ncbi:MAG: Rieske 2Fe-2S domain-containing protein [Candidatus Sumerlaeia bacterium]|nr:Rieske 2Fe-2S domain-containing protein [Candidatus Sumerlaeia bacterium]
MSVGDSTRREFLANVAMAVTILPGLGVGAAYVFRFLIPQSQQRAREVLLEKLDNLPVGASRLYKKILGNDLIAVRVSEREIRAFSSICTHLGCHVQWDPTEKNFLCPCHMGRFDTAGKVIAGPPPAPLPAFAIRIEGDNVFVEVPVKEV